MVKNKKYCQWNQEELDQALGAIDRGDMSLCQASKSYGIPKGTLSRHKNNVNIIAQGGVKFHGGNSVLGDDLECELATYCLELERRFFGLTMDEVRSMAYQLAEKNGFSHPFSHEKKMAGKKWFYSFMNRHPELSLRQPESTSLARAQGFNKPRVMAFFDLLEGIYDEHKFEASQIYNMDETSLTTVQDGQRKIIGEKGKKQVGAMTSQERGQSSTGVICCNAAGTFIPPMVIYRRKRMKAELANGAPPGTLVTCQEKGWMSNEGFCSWLEHFIKEVRPTKEHPCLLLLDGHITHTKNIQAIDMAREAGVVMVSLPPTPLIGCSHSMFLFLDRSKPSIMKEFGNGCGRMWVGL
jgi:hypothetical protein